MHRSISVLKEAIIKTKILFIIQSLEPCLAQSSRGRAVSGETDSPRGYFEISRWRIFIFHVGKKKFLGGIK